MRVILHPGAAEDFARALQHYATIQPELGQRFYGHVNDLLADIAAKPTLHRVYRTPFTRRHFRRPFPYAVVYVIKADFVWVLAVMHFKQPPGYWVYRSDT